MATTSVDNIATTLGTNESDILGPTRCVLFHGDTHKCDVVVAVRRFSCVLSILGCTFVIFLIWLFRKYVAFGQRFILYLSIASILYAIFFMTGYESEHSNVCSALGFMNNVLIWSVLLWVCFITFYIYMNAIWMKCTEKYEWAYCLAAIAIPVLISMLPFIGNHYGPAGPWCWIVNDWGWRFGIWYFPLIVIITILTSVYIYILVVFNRRLRSWGGTDSRADEYTRGKLKLDIQLLKRYPLVYIICSIFALINRIQNSVDPDNPVFALMILHALASPLPGMLNAVVFCLDRDTASKLTWTQLKLAFHSRRYQAKRSTIREYPPYNTNPPALEIEPTVVMEVPLAPCEQTTSNDTEPHQHTDPTQPAISQNSSYI